MQGLPIREVAKAVSGEEAWIEEFGREQWEGSAGLITGLLKGQHGSNP